MTCQNVVGEVVESSWSLSISAFLHKRIFLFVGHCLIGWTTVLTYTMVLWLLIPGRGSILLTRVGLLLKDRSRNYHL